MVRFPKRSQIKSYKEYWELKDWNAVIFDLNAKRIKYKLKCLLRYDQEWSSAVDEFTWLIIEGSYFDSWLELQKEMMKSRDFI